jgi:hypothetical protein
LHSLLWRIRSSMGFAGKVKRKRSGVSVSSEGALKGSTDEEFDGSRLALAASFSKCPLWNASSPPPTWNQRADREWNACLHIWHFVIGRGSHVSITIGPKPVIVHGGNTRDILVIGTTATLPRVATRWDVGANALLIMDSSGKLVGEIHGTTKLTRQVIHLEELACV